MAKGTKKIQTIEIKPVEETESNLLPELKGVDIDKGLIKQINTRFEPFFAQAQEWLEKAEAIEIKDITEIGKMKEAREARLGIRKIRTSAEKVKQELKERPLRECQTIDAIYNAIKDKTEPIETVLKEKEKFAELLEQQHKENVRAERQEKIEPYSEFMLPNVDLAEMDQGQFDELYAWTKGKWDNDQENKRKAAEAEENARLAKIEEDKRIREENERLRKEKEAADAENARIQAESDRKLAEQRAQLEAEQKAKEEKELAALNSLKEKYRAEAVKWLRKIGFVGDEKRMQHIDFDLVVKEPRALEFTSKESLYEWLGEVKSSIETLYKQKEEKEALEAQRIEREKENAKLQAEKEEEERKRKEAEDRAAALQKQMEEAEKVEKQVEAERLQREREQAQAPDKEKLRALAKKITDLALPELVDPKFVEVGVQVKGLLEKVVGYINTKIQ